jgi:hypothetical protein
MSMISRTVTTGTLIAKKEGTSHIVGLQVRSSSNGYNNYQSHILSEVLLASRDWVDEITFDGGNTVTNFTG